MKNININEKGERNNVNRHVSMVIYYRSYTNLYKSKIFDVKNMRQFILNEIEKI